MTDTASENKLPPNSSGRLYIACKHAKWVGGLVDIKLDSKLSRLQFTRMAQHGMARHSMASSKCTHNATQQSTAHQH